MDTVLFVPAASVTPQNRPLKPKLTVAILAVLCLALGAGWLFQHTAAVKERKFLEEKAAFLSNQWKQMSLEVAKQKQDADRLQARLFHAKAAEADAKALLVRKYLDAKDAYSLAFRGTTVTTTSVTPARSANRFARMGLPATVGDAVAPTMSGRSTFTTTTVRDEERVATLNRELNTARKALLAAFAPAAVVTAAERDSSYAVRAADDLAARLDPAAWKASKARTAAGR